MPTLKDILSAYTFNFRPAIQSTARLYIKDQLKKFDNPEKKLILDIGGRSSPYTCLLPGKYIVSDLPRESQLQNVLKLGINEKIIKNLKKRSNIKDVVYDDMTKTKFPANSFDGVICVEVLEHVQEDEKFIENVYILIKQNGFLIITTPNGDAIKCGGNPDHVRHYKKNELEVLLNKYFSNVEINYFVPITKAAVRSLPAWSLYKPIYTLFTMINGYISFRQSQRKYLNTSNNTWHIIGIANKIKQ